MERKFVQFGNRKTDDVEMQIIDVTVVRLPVFWSAYQVKAIVL